MRFLGAVVLLTLGTTWMASAVQITFKVNMSIQQALGNFTPGADPVYVAGGFNSWTPPSGALTQSVTNADVYEGTFDLTETPGATVSYKFVYGPVDPYTWEPNGVGPGGANDRELVMPAVDTVLPDVYWNNQSTLPSTRDVTFQINMSVQIALGDFDPINDFLNVAGDFNAWSTTASTLTQSGGDPNIWEGTFTVAGDTATTTFYKYVIASFSVGADVWENNDVGPGGAQNRELLLESGNQTLPVVYFNNLDTIPNPVDVTFQVDMTAQIALGNFVDGPNQVTAAGSFNAWDAISFVLTNDPGDPMVYKGVTTIEAASGSLVFWQYVIDGADWEEAVGNRVFTLGDTNNQAIDVVFWNNVGDLGPVATAPSGVDQVDVSWDPGTLVRLQKSTNLLNAWLEVPGTTGQSNATVTVTTPETYFRLIGP